MDYLARDTGAPMPPWKYIEPLLGTDPRCHPSPTTPAQFQYLVEKFANRLPNWKAATLPKSGRLILILSVLCAIPIHAMLAMNIPPKTLTALTKICRGFL